jgi:hypothetical protein
MSKFRKKPVVIEAVQVPEDVNHPTAWFDLFKFIPLHEVTRGGNMFGWVDIITLEGVIRASAGDWIIKGVKGEFYPCKPDIFAATYEPVE